MRFRARTPRRIFRDSIELVLSSAHDAVEKGRFPNVQIALVEMAANQRKATRLNVDIHNLLREAER